MDYSTVYWNSRLETEHQKLVQSFAPGDEVWDMFCGTRPLYYMSYIYIYILYIFI